jgi:undecaprenyl-diphosphatase
LADTTTLIQAAFLGVVEGVTEFLPISSTGHLILADRLLDFKGRFPSAEVFEVVIQFGAILAVCALYFDRLLRVALRLPYDPEARRFVLDLIVAFLPAAVLGLIFHDFIKRVLFSPWVVVTTLILGGVAILVIEAMRPKPRYEFSEELPVPTSLGIGFFQALAMIPGTSRSASTILGAMLLGVDRKAAAEFSFFLAIPTMLAATVLDLWKARGDLHGSEMLTIGVGFVVAMVTAFFVIKAFLRFITRHSFRGFGWYRIAAGIVMAIVLLAVHG